MQEQEIHCEKTFDPVNADGVFVTLKPMKKILKIALVIVVLALLAGAWIFLGPATGFSEAKKYLYIRSNAATKEAVLDSLQTENLITNKSAFAFLANRLDYWQNIRSGKYEIKKGSSLLTVVRMLRNGRQSPVDLVINKFRTKEDFARFTGARFEFDSAQMISFLNNADSMKRYRVDTATVFFNVLPNTYRYYWSTTPSAVYKKLHDEAEKFWNEERKAKAKALRLTPVQAYTLASIVEEETTNNKEKDTIASVYLNRLHKGMRLGADPTIKFALRDFSIKWIHGAMLDVPSPYNTYKNAGLPPGPVCTPSAVTLEAVLNAPSTNYLFFVANSKLNGHLFSQTFEEHVKKANLYRQEDKLRRQRDSVLNTTKSL